MKENKFRWICEGVNTLTFFCFLLADFATCSPAKFILNINDQSISTHVVAETMMMAYMGSALIIWIGWVGNRENIGEIRYSKSEQEEYKCLKITRNLKILRSIFDWIFVVFAASFWILNLLLSQYNQCHVQDFRQESLYFMVVFIFMASLIQTVLSLVINVLINVYISLGNNSMRQ